MNKVKSTNPLNNLIESDFTLDHKEKRLSLLKHIPQTFCCMTLLLSISITAAAQTTSFPHKKCLYISSYHKGYKWSDDLEEGIRSTIKNQCELKQFNMDAKRKKKPEQIQEAVNEALSIIEQWKPDILITSDDIAAKYLIVPNFKDADLPVVFSGVNWSVEEYKFPFSNVTGIVEVAPIEPMLKEAMKISKGKRAIYLGAKTLTEEKNYARIQKGTQRLQGELEKKLVPTFKEWLNAYEQAQEYDFIVIGSQQGIENWDEEKARAFAKEKSKKISITNHEWMMGVTALGYTKIPQEHGEWAAEASLAILSGVSPSDIPIITNRKWEQWVNSDVLGNVEKSIPRMLLRSAKKFTDSE